MTASVDGCWRRPPLTRQRLDLPRRFILNGRSVKRSSMNMVHGVVVGRRRNVLAGRRDYLRKWSGDNRLIHTRNIPESTSSIGPWTGLLLSSSWPRRFRRGSNDVVAVVGRPGARRVFPVKCVDDDRSSSLSSSSDNDVV
jgi:hypothetical protein